MTTQRLFKVSVALFFVAAYALVTTPKAQAAGCEATVEATDSMSFNTKNIDVPKTCKDFTINLKHTGKMPKSVMGHNLVISKKSDQQAVLSDGQAAGQTSQYVKDKDARVVAFTNIIGGGESATVKFAVSKLNPKDEYSFYCSFPGHSFMMNGAVKLQ